MSAQAAGGKVGKRGRVKAVRDLQFPYWREVADGLPDDEMTVLIALDDGEVWTGFHDGDSGWRYVSGDLVESATVTHWMDFPPAPFRRGKGEPK